MVSAVAVTRKWQWPDELAIIAGSGVGVAVARSWGHLLAADTGVKVRVAAEDNVAHRLRFIASGLFHLTAGGNAKTRQTLVAEPAFAWRDGGPFPVRVAWSQSRDNAGFIVRADSPIKSVYDIKPGTRLVSLTAAATSPIYELLLAWAKVGHNEIAWVTPQNAGDKVPAVMDGRADLSFAIPTSPQVYEAEKTPPGIRWIPLNTGEDPEGAGRAREVDPLINFAPIINGVPSSIGIWGTCGISLYTTRAAADEGLVYQLARWLDDNLARYRDLHSWNKFMTREVLMEEIGHTFLPCHRGLIKYLRELGLWTEAHQRRQTENESLVDRYCQAYRAAIDLADEKAVVVSPENDKWLGLWDSQKKALGLPDFHTFASL